MSVGCPHFSSIPWMTEDGREREGDLVRTCVSILSCPVGLTRLIGLKVMEVEDVGCRLSVVCDGVVS